MFKKFFGNLSKMPELTGRYQVSAPPEGEVLHKQTVQIEAVRYRRCVDVILSSQGFFFSVNSPFSKYENILVPWSDIGDFRDDRLYGMAAHSFAAGRPPINRMVVYKDLWARMGQYMG